MIDIQVDPKRVKEAKQDIKDIIRRHNRYNQFDMIDIRDYDGRFVRDAEWMFVINNRTDGDFFIRICFDGDYKIQEAISAHFGASNVGWC